MAAHFTMCTYGVVRHFDLGILVFNLRVVKFGFLEKTLFIIHAQHVLSYHLSTTKKAIPVHISSRSPMLTRMDP